MKTITNDFAKDLHDELRNILINYNNPEYGDCIIDEITNLFGYPDTIAVAPEEGTPPEVHEISLSMTVESAKQFLKDNGYFVDNLWTVHDVKEKFNCTDEQAQSVLNDALTNEATMSQIQFSIDEFAGLENLPKIGSKYFSISGFWKDTKVKFSNMIVKELEELAEDDDENIFYYDLSEEEICQEIKLGWSGTLDFVITSYEETTLN
mgnify:CR=1 FL=1